MSCSISDLTSQSFPQTRNPFLHFVHFMLGVWLGRWCFNNVCIKFRESYVGFSTCLTLQSILEILPFLHKQIINQFSFFLHKNCTLFEIASRSNALSNSLHCFLKIQYFLRFNALTILCYAIKINLSKKKKFNPTQTLFYQKTT